MTFASFELWFYLIFTGWTKIDGLAFFKQSPHRNPLSRSPVAFHVQNNFSLISVNDSSKELEMLMKLVSGKRQRGKQTFEGISGFSSQEQLICLIVWREKRNEKSSSHLSPTTLGKKRELSICLLWKNDDNKKYKGFLFWINMSLFC